MRGTGWLSIGTVLLMPAAFAAGPLPGCESPAEVRATIDDLFNSKSLWKMPFAEQTAARRRIYERLVKDYPREWETNRRLIRASPTWDPTYGAEVRERYLKQARANPDDPLALELAGFALIRVNTPEAIRLLEAARSKAPEFPWAALDLAEIYSTGKFANPAKAAEHLRAYFRMCPESLHDTAHDALSKSQDRELQSKVTAAVRVKLEKETRPPRPQDWTRLWGLEFRSRPPAEHAALRQQIAEDLKRLGARKTTVDDQWLLFLRDGYKQAGASAQSVRSIEDRILQQSPGSMEAFRIESRRRFDTIKPPSDPKDAEAWSKYRAGYRETVRQWVERFSEVDQRMLKHMYLLAVLDDDTATGQDGAAALESYLKVPAYGRGDSFNRSGAARALVDRGWFPERALALSKESLRLSTEEQPFELPDDTLTEAQKEQRSQWQPRNRQFCLGTLLRSTMRAGTLEDVAPFRAEIEGPSPARPEMESDYWLNRARLAVIEKRKADALLYYQTALRTRKNQPKMFGGRLRDEVTDEASLLWKDLGGSEAAWAQWLRPASPERQPLTSGAWEQPKKPLPAFELPDLTGKTWRLSTLEGKTLLINLWATWCGPCLGELPKLQTLYEQVKGRKDLQVLTFNIDEELGLVEPFLKEKGYTFPVLTAFEFARTNVDPLGVPQNWLVDPKGVWRWTQMGYDSSDADWAGTMLKKLESLAPR